MGKTEFTVIQIMYEHRIWLLIDILGWNRASLLLISWEPGIDFTFDILWLRPLFRRIQRRIKQTRTPPRQHRGE